MELPENTHTVELAYPDASGILRGKRIPVSAWSSVARNGLHTANIALTWTARCDIRDDDTWVTADTGWPDMHLMPRLDDMRAIPWRPGSTLVLAEPISDDIQPVDPRTVLKKVLERANSMGYGPQIGFEIEFYILDAETRQPLHDDIQYAGIARGAEYEHVMAPMRNWLVEFGIPVEACLTEYAPGQFEVNIQYDEALRTADNAVLFRTGVKEIAAQHGYIASFMAKITSDQSGSGVHLHHSLWENGRNAFADGGKLSTIGEHYLGGLQRHMPAFSIFGSPTPNSFKRRQPYTFCPLNSTWGIDNRTVGIRAIEGDDNAVRLEQRDGSSDANPYLIMAAQIAAGLNGIEEGIEPTPEFQGDAYAGNNAESLPTTVPGAVAALRQSELAAKVFGEPLLDTVIGMALWEHNFVNDRVSDIERDRYLEVF